MLDRYHLASRGEALAMMYRIAAIHLEDYGKLINSDGKIYCRVIPRGLITREQRLGYSFSPNGPVLVACLDDRTVTVYDSQSDTTETYGQSPERKSL